MLERLGQRILLFIPQFYLLEKRSKNLYKHKPPPCLLSILWDITLSMRFLPRCVYCFLQTKIPTPFKIFINFNNFWSNFFFYFLKTLTPLRDPGKGANLPGDQLTTHRDSIRVIGCSGLLDFPEIYNALSKFQRLG